MDTNNQIENAGTQMLCHIVESAPLSKGFCNSPSGSAVSALQSKFKEISQRQSKGNGPPEFLQKTSVKEPSSLSILDVKILKSSSWTDEVSDVQNLTTSNHLKENKWKKEGESMSSLDCGPREVSRIQNLTSGESSTVLSKPTSFPTCQTSSKSFWKVAQSETLVSNRDFDSLPIIKNNLVNTRKEQSTLNRGFQKKQNLPNEPEKAGISEKKKVQTNKLTSAMFAKGQCQPPLINKGLPPPHKEARLDKTILWSEINFGSDLTLSPRHERAKRLLERARLKTCFQNQNSDPETLKVTQRDVLELLPICNPPPQIVNIHERKVPLSVQLQDVESRQSQLLSHSNFENKLKKEAEHCYLDNVGYQGLGLIGSSLSQRQTKAQPPLKVSQDSKSLESSYGRIQMTNQGDSFLRPELSKDKPKKCEACGSILTPSYPKETRQIAEGQRNSGNQWIFSGQSSHHFIQPNFSEGTMLTGRSSRDKNFVTAGPSNARERVSAFGKLRRRSRKGENRVEASHGPYARGQELLAQRRNSRTKSSLEEMSGPHSKPTRGVTFAMDSFIPTATNSFKSCRDASGIQLPIKSALKSGSKSRPAEKKEVKNLPLCQEMTRSSHFAVATPQDHGATSQVSQVSIGLRYPSPVGTSVEAVDGLSPSEDPNCAASCPPECWPIVRGAAMSKTDDLRAKLLRFEHCKAELQWDEHLGASRRTLDREGRPKLSLRRFFSAMGLNSMGNMGKYNRSSSMEHLSPSSTRDSSSQTHNGQTLLQKTPSLQAIQIESPLAQLCKASSVQSLQSPKKKHEHSTILRELHLPLILGPRNAHFKKEMENLDATQVSGPTGQIVQTFPDGSLLLELTRPINAPFGFVISRRKGRPDSGLYVEQVVGSTTENIYTSLLGVGDEILKVNGEKVTGLSLDQVTCLMTRESTATVQILPHRWIQH